MAALCTSAPLSALRLDGEVAFALRTSSLVCIASYAATLRQLALLGIADAPHMALQGLVNSLPLLEVCALAWCSLQSYSMPAVGANSAHWHVM